MAIIRANNNTLSSVTELPTAIPTGSMFKLQKQTASDSSSINFTNTYITSSYNYYILICKKWKPASSSVPRIRFSEDNLSTFENDTYRNGILYWVCNTTSQGSQGATTTGYHNLNQSLLNTDDGNYIMHFPALNVTGKHKCIVHATMKQSGGNTHGHTYGLSVETERTYNSFQLYMSSGNITSGDFTLYGVTE